MARKVNSGGRPRGFWDWFLIGAATAAVYNLFKNPSGMACCGCFALVIVLIVGVMAVFLIAQFYVWALLIALAIVGWRLWVRYRDKKNQAF